MGSRKTTEQGTDDMGSDLRASIASIESRKRSGQRNWLALETLQRLLLLLVFTLTSTALLFGQTTNGLMTGVITDSSGAVVAEAQIRVTNQGTNALRTATSDNKGYYMVPQLAPGIYSVSVGTVGFATQTRVNVQLQVNQSMTIDFALQVSSQSQTIEVTGEPPQLNTTSATLGDVVGHDAIVDLPLNGRQFTQLTLLAPGAVPQEAAQQSANLVPLGAGGIVPTVDGQRPRQNNFTMDGVLNNYIYANTWAISPPPDALQEFNVQSHITDAQFAISTGANINIVTRSGTNSFHGALWEFIRNDVLDAQTFPQTSRLPYRQNQYGVYFGGPVMLPHFNGKDKTWFAVYWEGFRSNQSSTSLGDTFLPAMLTGDFSGLLGAQVGTDDLGRPEYANEIYDPSTSRTDPKNPRAIIRDPFMYHGQLNVIPPGDINPAALLIAQKYYPAPNLNVAPGVLPNIAFNAATITASDQTGIRIDRRLSENDTVFGRYNRSNINALRPGALPTNPLTATEYGQNVALGYTHLFGQSAILSLHYGYLNVDFGREQTPAGAAFVNSIGMADANPSHDGLWFGPNTTMSNGYAGVAQTIVKNGPMNGQDSHADFSKAVGRHTFGAGGIYYHIHGLSDGWQYTTGFTQTATSLAGTAANTGLGPASFMLGLPNSLAAVLGNSAADQTVNWFGGYVQDQWQATGKLALTAGIRWDFVTPANFHKIVSGLNPLTGQFLVTGAVPPTYPTATASSGMYNPQYNGFEPRFGISYAATQKTVLHIAFAVLDDHNNNLIQQNQDLRVTWPSAIQTSVSLLNQSLPTVFLNNLPPASYYLTGAPQYVGYGVNPDNKIPYSIEYNAGIEQQFSGSMVLELNYVGSVSRHLFIEPLANTATIPGPGTLASRGQPFPQYGTFNYDSNGGSASYNSLQAELKKQLSSGLYFTASYTWSKSLDLSSDAYSGSIENIYNLKADWGRSDFDRSQLLVLNGMYQLPVGNGRRYLSNSSSPVQLILGGWNAGGIVSLISGQPFNATAGGDIANVGGPAGAERAQRIGSPYSGVGFVQTPSHWLNNASFMTPTQYTFGNEGRNDLVGPAFTNVDFTTSKNFPLPKESTLQFRAEFFNVLNHTNYGTPTSSVQSTSFGSILSAAGSGREIQFAAKVVF
jgi:Carboxypeptidase regulatory-like domain/TonB dependent receptor